jgi:hypothetical protein
VPTRAAIYFWNLSLALFTGIRSCGNFASSRRGGSIVAVVGLAENWIAGMEEVKVLRAIIGNTRGASPRSNEGQRQYAVNAAYTGYDRDMKKTLLFTMVVLLTAAAFAEPYHHHHRRHRHHHVDVVTR